MVEPNPNHGDSAEGIALVPGRIVGRGRFRLTRPLGRGGMGVVWLAQDERLDEAVALKFLPPDICHDLVALDELRQETLKTRKLSHPHIVRIHDLHEVKGEPSFISMEYVDGSNLSALRLEQNERVLAWARLRPWVEQLCEALDYAHNEKVIHRDLKPGNLMVDSHGRLKLADFGIAATVSDSISRISQRHATSGTLAYMSPQQLEGHRAMVADDIYALGATLYELLTSKPPFYSGDISHQVLHMAPAPLSERLAELELTNEIPSDVAALVMACLAKDPAQRPQNARAVAAWIGLELETKPSFKVLSREVNSNGHPKEEDMAAGPAKPLDAVPPGKQRKRLWAGAAITAMVLLGFGIWQWRTRLAHDYFPLAVGASWEFTAEVKLHKTGGEDEIRQGSEVCRCVAMERIGDREYLKVITTLEGFPDTPQSVTWYRRAADGIYRIDGKTDNPERLFLALPLAHGRTWSVDGPGGKSVSTIEKAGRVVLPERSYRNCYKLHVAGTDEQGKIVSQQAFYLARGYGGVKADIDTGTLTLKLMLRKFSPPLRTGALREQRGSGFGTEPDRKVNSASVQTTTPFTNRMGMVFVPVPGTKVWFSIWEIRVRDFEAFVKATGYNANAGMLSLQSNGRWATRGDTWSSPGFPQTRDHPVVGVSWKDAKAFCDWLTSEAPPKDASMAAPYYRLPTDEEWSLAAGLGNEPGRTPKTRSCATPEVYPWGYQWPPPAKAGNYAGQEARRGRYPADSPVIDGYDDGFPETAPVGSFLPSDSGLFDLGGNVWEWCEDWLDENQNDKVLRGASWNSEPRMHLWTSCRCPLNPAQRNDYCGFRCVLVMNASAR